MPEDSIDPEEFMGGYETDTSYLLCVGSAVVASMATGALLLNTAGVVLGGTAGLVYGLKSCKTLSPATTRKIYGANERMTPVEFGLLVRQVRVAFPKLGRQQVLDLIARERYAVLAKAQC